MYKAKSDSMSLTAEHDSQSDMTHNYNSPRKLFTLSESPFERGRKKTGMRSIFKGENRRMYLADPS